MLFWCYMVIICTCKKRVFSFIFFKYRRLSVLLFNCQAGHHAEFLYIYIFFIPLTVKIFDSFVKQFFSYYDKTFWYVVVVVLKFKMSFLTLDWIHYHIMLHPAATLKNCKIRCISIK